MLFRYPVYLKDNVIGYLTVTEAGLYSHYSGSFKIELEGIYRLYACTSRCNINLGVCKPDQGLWHISGRIAKSKINWENARYAINYSGEQEAYIQINENEPFSHLEILDRCRLQRDKKSYTILVKLNI